jgi:hypothetical protein
MDEYPKYKCDNCKILLKNNFLYDHYKKDKHYLFCRICLKSLEICSKSRCKKLFLLIDSDLDSLKTIYLNNNQQFFIFNDVKTVILNKYGDLDNLQKILLVKKKNRELKLKKSSDNKSEREKKLKESLFLNKLEYKNYGDCYSFIHYGQPSLNTVIENELKKNINKNERRIELASELIKFNISLDETLTSCYEFINNLNSKSLDETIKSIQVEYFLKYDTEYEKLSRIYDSNKAQNIVIEKYTDKHYMNKNLDKIKLKFE